jgi:hypothetical protein
LSRTLATTELAVASQHTVSHFLFHGGIFDKNSMTVVPPNADKTEKRHCDTTEVIEAESQAALKILAERDFQDAIKKAKALGTVHTRCRVQIQYLTYAARKSHFLSYSLRMNK